MWGSSVSDERRTDVRVAVRVVRRIEGLLPVSLMIALGAFVLLIAAAEEPYHIDELRQVRSYDRDLAGVVKASIEQEQPPLDALLNAAAQKVLGVGDVRQRFLSVLFGIGSLIVIAVLAIRSGFTTLGAVSAVGVMSLTPVLIGVTAYARPYALPMFLMLCFLVLANRWMRRGEPWVLLSLVVIAVLLPWSRTVEPLIFLVITGVVMVSMIWTGHDRRRAFWVLSVAAIGVISSVPALVLLSDQLADRTASESSSWQRLSRLGSEVPATIGTAFPYWPLIAAVAVLGIAQPAARRLLARLWWWWILAGTAGGFVLAFVLVAPVSQSFFGRYLFTWVPPVAVLAGAIVSSVTVDTDERLSARSWLATLAAALIVFWGATVTWHDLSTRSTADWKAASEVLVDDLPQDIAVVYDQLRPLGAYRTPFAGYPRYTKGHPRVPLSLQLIRNPSALSPGSNTAVVLLSGGSSVDLPGWTAIGVDAFFTVYLPTTPRPGLLGAAEAAQEFAEALRPDLGAALMLTAASLWHEADDEDRAESLMRSLLADDDLRSAVIDAVAGSPLEDYVTAGT